MSWFDEWLQNLGAGFYVTDPDDVEFTPVKFEENTQFYQTNKQEAKDKILDMIEQAKEKGLPLTWLTQEVKKL